MTNHALAITTIALALWINGDSLGFAPEDEQVSAYLEEHGLDVLLEVQLFDRLQQEKDSTKRLALADQLSEIYRTQLVSKGLSERDRMDVRLRSQVLVGMMPPNTLLELRVELLVQQYADHEQAADHDRIGLLNPDAKALAIVAMEEIVSELERISKLADSQAMVLDRSAARSKGQRQGDQDRKRTKMIGLRSRSNFFLGWAGYSYAALNGSKVEPETLRAFGWVLGFKGQLPVLDRLDVDLLEYDHVARAVLGVAMCKALNQDTGEARVWFKVVQDSDDAPQFTKDFAQQRQLEVYLSERNWIASKQAAIELENHEPESLLGVAQSRLLVLKTLQTRGSGSRGKGGSEGIEELAKMGLGRLIDLGEIGHVLELHERFGALPLLNVGFVSLYTQGLSELARSNEGGGNAGYAQASVKFSKAIQADDAERYGIHAADAVLKLAFCELRQRRAKAAAEVLTQYDNLIVESDQREEAAWLMILAYDEAVRSGQDQMSEMMTTLIGEYLHTYPSTERANVLIVRYAMSPHIEADDAIGSLVIDDPDDALAIPARRKLIQLLYKNPDLVEGGEVQLHEVVVEHAKWLWANEPVDSVNVREGRERLAVCRVVLATGLAAGLSAGGSADVPDLGQLDQVIQRGLGIMEEFSALDGVRSEFLFRRVQVLLLQGDYVQAGEIAMGKGGGGGLDDSVVGSALLMVFEQAIKEFDAQQNITSAQGVVRYGRGVLDAMIDDSRDGLDWRLSIVAEGIAGAALYLADELGDETMRAYGAALSDRVFLEGHPTANGLVRTAVLNETNGHLDTALECWLRLVSTVSEAEELWHRARYESLRLLMMTDEQQARSVYGQYQALQPEGSPEPWGGLITGLFEVGEVGGDAVDGGGP